MPVSAATHAKAKPAAERAAALRARDAAHGWKQVNVRVPVMMDTTLQIVAQLLREGQRVEGLVIRDPKTGRVRTMIL